MLVRSALLLLALALPAAASTDVFGVGNGKDGAIEVSTPGVVVNAYTGTAASVAAGADRIRVEAPALFSVGDLVLVVRSRGIAATAASGARGPFELTAGDAGVFELARIASKDGADLVFTAPLDFAYSIERSQVVRVPEYTDVTIAAGASITAPAWNGRSGGIVAFLATGPVDNEGRIAVNGAGFRGGVARTGSGDYECSGLDEAAPRGAEKGEGVTGVYDATITGRGNRASGGGGGVCHNSGGGGGAH